jgi:hypothetical protein
MFSVWFSEQRAFARHTALNYFYYNRGQVCLLRGAVDSSNIFRVYLSP